MAKALPRAAHNYIKTTNKNSEIINQGRALKTLGAAREKTLPQDKLWLTWESKEGPSHLILVA